MWYIYLYHMHVRMYPCIYKYILRQMYIVYSCRLTTANIVQETPWIKFLFKCFTIVNIIYTCELQHYSVRALIDVYYVYLYIDETTFYYYCLFYTRFIVQCASVTVVSRCCGRGGQILPLLLCSHLKTKFGTCKINKIEKKNLTITVVILLNHYAYVIALRYNFSVEKCHR